MLSQTHPTHIVLSSAAERAVVFESSSEVELLAGLLDDDAAAWHAFTRRYGRLLQSCIGRIVTRFSSVVRPEDTAEILSMLYLQLLASDKKKLRSFSSERGAKLGTWLGMLATHCAYDYLRRVRRVPRHAELSEAEHLAAETPDPATVALQRERVQRVDGLLSALTGKDREFLELYFTEGLEPEEVARRMGISVKTVYSKKHKIQRRLESLLAGSRLAA